MPVHAHPSMPQQLAERCPPLALPASRAQWKQIGSDPTGLRLQVRFVKKVSGPKTGFVVEQIRATVPDAPKSLAPQ